MASTGSKQQMALRGGKKSLEMVNKRERGDLTRETRWPISTEIRDVVGLLSSIQMPKASRRLVHHQGGGEKKEKNIYIKPLNNTREEALLITWAVSIDRHDKWGHSPKHVGEEEADDDYQRHLVAPAAHVPENIWNVKGRKKTSC